MILAQEIIKQDESGVYNQQDIAHMMIKYAKLHVQEALKQASEKAQAGSEYSHHEGEFEDIPVYLPVINQDSILNAYPLDNIK